MLVVFGLSKFDVRSDSKTGKLLYVKLYTEQAKTKRRDDRIICFRVITAANSKNAVIKNY